LGILETAIFAISLCNSLYLNALQMCFGSAFFCTAVAQMAFLMPILPLCGQDFSSKFLLYAHIQF
jgi:hypothetical protein